MSPSAQVSASVSVASRSCSAVAVPLPSATNEETIIQKRRVAIMASAGVRGIWIEFRADLASAVVKA
jgi:hypothetical protein